MRLVSGLLLSSVLIACGGPGGAGDDGPDPDPQPDAGSQPDATPDASPDDPKPQPCTGRACYDARAYALTASFDWDRRRLVGHEDITLAVTAPTIAELDAEVEVSRVHAGGRDLPFTVDAATHTLRVDLTSLTAVSTTPQPVTFTVDYEAATARALVTAGARDDDPVASRVVYTNSEPIYGSQWLIGKHDPSDRALWSVELTVAADEDVIANGTRITDRVAGARRTVRYEMDRPLPTYLMAFAAGQLVHTDRAARVPLSLWYRRGLLIDPSHTLDMVADAMASFERLLGPYPWDSYGVVLLPGFPGGMENATITFNDEASGVTGGFGLNAHELAHHWFGDWVTMRHYDDAWIKEGMATLLQSEATRATRDREHKGRGYGRDFDFYPGDAIVDPDLKGLDKYTSGPYSRAAWMLTQIRTRIGEDAFWKSLRTILAEHALDSIDGETFVRHFAPALDEASILRMVASLDEHDDPSLDIASVAIEGGTQLTLQLHDPGATMLLPVELTVVDAAGVATVHTVGTDAPTTVVVPVDGYLAPDERDLGPVWGSSLIAEHYWDAVSSLLMPVAPAAIAAFETRSASHQERAAADGLLFAIDAARFVDIYQHLDSQIAQEQALFDGCEQRSNAADPAPWDAALAPLLAAPPLARFNQRYARCGAAPAGFEDELNALIAHPTGASIPRVQYLLSFDYGIDHNLALASKMAAGSPSLTLRDQAIDRAAAQPSYAFVPDDQQAPWRAFFATYLDAAASTRRLLAVWRGIADLGDTSLLPKVAAAIRRIKPSAYYQRQIACEVHWNTDANGNPDAWATFKAAMGPVADLPASVASVLEDSARCDQ